jgi:hypothetical protein
MRPRRPPSADRIAISPVRVDALASSRFATLAHEISNTMPTALNKTSRPVRTSPTTTSSSVTTLKLFSKLL